VVDEGTSSLHVEAEERVYECLRRRRVAVLSVGHRPSLVPLHDEVITNPSNLVFGVDGSLFVASFPLDHIVRFQFPAVGRRLRYTIFATDLDGPSALAVDEASGGGLFVASFGGDEVLRFGPDGSLLQRYGNEEEVDCPEGLAVLDGLLYVSSWHRGWVVRYNISTGAFLGQFVSPPAKSDTHPLAPPPPPQATAFPEELAFTPSGDLLVSHFYSNTLMLYGGDDGEAMGPLLRGKVLRGPVGMVVGPDGHIYVGSYRRNVVLRLAADTGTVLDVVAARGELNGLAGIAFAPDGALYVSSYEDSRVLRFNVSEVPTKPWEAGRRRGGGDGETEAEGEERKSANSWKAKAMVVAVAAVVRVDDNQEMEEMGHALEVSSFLPDCLPTPSFVVGSCLRRDTATRSCCASCATAAG
jgi:hypothetical protein